MLDLYFMSYWYDSLGKAYYQQWPQPQLFGPVDMMWAVTQFWLLQMGQNCQKFHCWYWGIASDKVRWCWVTQCAVSLLTDHAQCVFALSTTLAFWFSEVVFSDLSGRASITLLLTVFLTMWWAPWHYGEWISKWICIDWMLCVCT